MIRHKLFLASALALASGAAGCAHMTPTERGMGVGGLIGAGTGALVGNAVGKTGAGALVGAGVGALTGGLMGNAVEQAEHRAEVRAANAAAAQAPPRGPLGMMDVVSMSQSGVSDPVIISQIRTTGSVFHLSSNDTIYLEQQGVSDPVITEMLATANRYPPRRIYTPVPVYPAPVYQPVYVVPPPPPVGVSFGFYSRFPRHCH